MFQKYLFFSVKPTKRLGEIIFVRSSNIWPQTTRKKHHARFMSVNNHSNISLLEKLTGCDPLIINKTFQIYPNLEKVGPEIIHRVYNLLKEIGFTNEGISQCLPIFGTHPQTLQNRYMVFEEAGFDTEKITPVMLYRYVSVSRKQISLLKTRKMMKDVDVVESFASSVDMPASICPKLSESCLLKDAQVHMMKIYLKWYLGMSTLEVDRTFKVYNRLNQKSLRLTRETLTMLENDLNFTQERIRKHAYLIHTDTYNLRQILDQVKFLGGVPVKTVLLGYPKIMSSPVESIVKVTEVLNKYKIPDEHIARVFDIYTLSPETIDQRLSSYISDIPQFSVFLMHPAVLKLVLYKKKAMSRLAILEQMKIKCVSMNLLSTRDSNFDKFTQEGEDRTRGDDIVHYLSIYLAIQGKLIRKKLIAHPYWYHVSICTVRDTLQYLITLNFTKEDLFKNIHVLLYPKTFVEQEYLKLESQANIDMCRTSKGVVKKENVLPLILYFIELPYHFSGGGIFPSSTS